MRDRRPNIRGEWFKLVILQSLIEVLVSLLVRHFAGAVKRLIWMLSHTDPLTDTNHRGFPE